MKWKSYNTATESNTPHLLLYLLVSSRLVTSSLSSFSFLSLPLKKDWPKFDPVVQTKRKRTRRRKRKTTKIEGVTPHVTPLEKFWIIAIVVLGDKQVSIVVVNSFNDFTEILSSLRPSLCFSIFLFFCFFFFLLCARVFTLLDRNTKKEYPYSLHRVKNGSKWTKRDELLGQKWLKRSKYRNSYFFFPSQWRKKNIPREFFVTFSFPSSSFLFFLFLSHFGHNYVTHFSPSTHWWPNWLIVQTLSD